MPSSPIEVGFIDTPGNATDVAISEIYAFVTNYDDGLRVIDVSMPSSPVEAGFVDTPGVANGVAVSGRYAFVADWLIRLDPINPQTTARMSSAFDSWRQYDAARQSLIEAELKRIAATPDLSTHTAEMVERILKA